MSSSLQRDTSVSVQVIGGPTAIVVYGGLRFLTDPTFDAPRAYPSSAVKLEPPALAAEAIGAIDAVLLSHDHHLDNLDEAGRAFLPQAARVLTTAEGALRLGGSATGLEPFDTVEVDRRGGDPVRITAVPAHHGPADFAEENGPVIGFVLQAEALPVVYVSGDNASVDVVRKIAQRIGQVDIAVLFAGAARVATKAGGAPLTLTASDAADAARILGARIVVPIHHSGWGHYSEGAQELRRAFLEAGLDDRLAIAEPGATVTMSSVTPRATPRPSSVAG